MRLSVGGPVFDLEFHLCSDRFIAIARRNLRSNGIPFGTATSTRMSSWYLAFLGRLSFLGSEASFALSLTRLEDQITRYETPNSQNRWDFPLYTLHPEDSLEDLVPTAESEAGVSRFEQIRRMLVGGKMKPNVSTIRVRRTKTSSEF